MKPARLIIFALLLFTSAWAMGQSRCSQDFISNSKEYLNSLEQYRDDLIEMKKKMEASYSSRRIGYVMAAIARGPNAGASAGDDFDRLEIERRRVESERILEVSLKVSEAKMKFAERCKD
jgi:hypothetical protein